MSAKMSASSESEGEIRERDTPKATTTQPRSKAISVNRLRDDSVSPVRSQRSLRSPSPSASRLRESSMSPHRRGRYSRSPPGARKRRYPDEHRGDNSRSDAREFRVHYEDRRNAREDDRRGYYGRSGYGASSRDDTSRYNERAGRTDHESKRQRTRSRSPVSAHSTTRQDLPGAGPYGMKFEKERSAEMPGRIAQDARSHRRLGSGGSNTAMAMNEDQKTTTNMEADTGSIGTKGVKFSIGTKPAAEAPEEPKSPPKAEVLSAEERRKRREAIKAKYKNQTNPLLVQALQQESAPGSPASQADASDVRSERSVSPGMFAPQTPQMDSAAGSPASLNINDDFELANTNYAPDTSGDEPSAADYDAYADMAEERARHDKRNTESEVPASQYDETKQHDQQVLLPEALLEGQKAAAVKKAKPGDDMFASDDEDDMFAPVQAKNSTTGDESGIAVSVPTAKELDQSLLDNWDDPEGYYRIILGELLDGRYHVQANLGKGMFSGVIRAADNATGRLVAIKIIRNNETMIKAAMKEMDILQKLADADPEDKKHVIRLERSFTHKGHMCMVFEHMSINLREVLKKFGRDVGINLKAVRSYAQQIFLGLTLLRKANILHADLKPDNILVNDARSMLKICDLGSAADASENEITPYLVSRFYRAPEIILGIPYDFAIDMWSIGCTLYELYTGKILFTGRTNNQMLRSIMECRGKFSLKMLKKAEFGAVHFDDVNLNFRSVERDKVTGRDVVKMINFVKPTRDLKSRLLAAAGGAGSSKKTIPEVELKEVNLFADLLDRCLNLNPEKRITPAEALKHPFIHRAAPVPSSVRA